MVLQRKMKLVSTLHTPLTALFSPQDAGHTQKPIDAPHAVALHDFPAGKGIDNKWVGP